MRIFIPSVLAFIISVFSLAVHADTSRIGMVSRACNWDSTPKKVVVLGLVEMDRSGIPTPEAGSYYERLSSAQKKTHWLFESFTTYYAPLLNILDATQTLYHLRVNAATWYRVVDPGKPMYFISGYYKHKQYESGWQSKWAQSPLPAPMNLIFFRARAGGGEWPYFYHPPFNDDRFTYGQGFPSVSFTIKGEHWYKNGLVFDNSQPVFLGYTRATDDCNLTKWGFFWETP